MIRSQEEDDDRGELPPWTDASEFSPTSLMGTGFWAGLSTREEQGPLRGWWIRSLYFAARKHAPDAGSDLWARMVLWLVEEGEDGGYLTFITSDYFAPFGTPTLRDASGGYWEVATQQLERDLPKAFAWAQRATGYSQTLDEFLEDPAKHAVVAPREESALRVLERLELWDARNRWLESSLAVRQHWPRNCTECGESYRPDGHRKTVRCPQCRESSRKQSNKRTSQRSGRIGDR